MAVCAARQDAAGLVAGVYSTDHSPTQKIDKPSRASYDAAHFWTKTTNTGSAPREEVEQQDSSKSAEWTGKARPRWHARERGHKLNLTQDVHTMREYVLRRLLLLIPTLLGVTFIVFLMMRFIPGDPITNMLGESYAAEDAQKLRHELGLDQPLVVQYSKWVLHLLSGDWGRSILSNRPVLSDILYRLPVSIELLILSMIVSLLVALPAGIIAAVWPNTWKDYSAMMIAMAGVSIPEFFLGVLLFLLFALLLRWFPVAGHIPFSDSISGNLQHMLLPTIALGLPRAALLTRLIRASLLEVLKMEYVTTARAKGLRETFIVLKHALKNALIPTITVVGLQVGFLIGGAIVVETVFAMPGIGSFGVDAIIKRDYPQVQAFVLVGALVFVVANLSVDLLYSVVDPRIQYGKEV